MKSQNHLLNVSRKLMKSEKKIEDENNHKLVMDKN